MINTTSRPITIQPGGETTQLTVNQSNVYSCGGWKDYIDPSAGYTYYGVKMKKMSWDYNEVKFKKEGTGQRVLVPASVSKVDAHSETKKFLVKTGIGLSSKQIMAFDLDDDSEWEV